MTAIDARLVRDTLDTPAIADVAAAAHAALAPVLARARLRAGARVAVTAGSRGVARLDLILRGACDAGRRAGVKPHTDFTGTIESGVLKMTAIGLGKAIGAARYHAAFARFGYEPIIREVAALLMERVPIVAGLAVVEDNRGGTNAVEAFAPDAIAAGEERLLLRARELMGKLPFAALDLVIVDRMGKNFSGTGMDTNVTGRAVDGRTQKVTQPVIRQLYVRELSAESGGNATGIGLADFCTRRLADAID